MLKYVVCLCKGCDGCCVFCLLSVVFSVCRVFCFVIVLCGCVWYICSYVRKKALLQCLCNYWEEGYGSV